MIDVSVEELTALERVHGPERLETLLDLFGKAPAVLAWAVRADLAQVKGEN